MIEASSHDPVRRAGSRLALAGLLAASIGGWAGTAQAIPSPPSPADEPAFMEFVIDHHFSALRMTELAAGTSATAPTAGFPATPAKATDPLVLQLSITNNAMQRTQIGTLQGFLQDFYSISYQPQLMPSGHTLIGVLDAAAPGDPFDIAFLEAFSDHHASLLGPAQACTSEAPHAALRQLCGAMVQSQGRDIAMMQSRLCEAFGICGFAPTVLAPDQTVPPPIDRLPVAVSEPPGSPLVAGTIAMLLLGWLSRRERWTGRARSVAARAATRPDLRHEPLRCRPVGG